MSQENPLPPPGRDRPLAEPPMQNFRDIYMNAPRTPAEQEAEHDRLAAQEPLWVTCRVCNLGGHTCPGCGVDVPHEGPRTCTTCTQQIERGER